MKRFTIIFSILLVLGFAGALVFVGMSEDFVNPAEAAQMGADRDSPIWSMTLDELLEQMEGQGLIDRSSSQLLASGGLCSDAVKVSGAEFYWWDLENLEEDSAEYKAYKQLQEEGIIDLYGSGNIMSPIPNGPFALLLTFYEGDVDALDKAFRSVGQTGGGRAPVWSMTHWYFARRSSAWEAGAVSAGRSDLRFCFKPSTRAGGRNRTCPKPSAFRTPRPPAWTRFRASSDGAGSQTRWNRLPRS